MKTKIIAIFCVLLTIMLAGSAFASLTVSDFTLGDDRTQRENPKGDDDRDREGDVVDATFTVANSGSENITNINFLFAALQNNYNLSFSETNFDLNAGAPAKTITVTGIVWSRLGSLTTWDNDDDEERRLEAGKFTVSGTENGSSISTQSTMFAQAEPGLEVRSLEVLIDGTAYRPGDDEVEEIAPGSRVAIRFELENNFEDESNLDIDGDITFDTNNRDIEFDDRSEDFDIRTERSESFTFDLDIDWRDVEDGDDVILSIFIEGTDDNGAIHKIDIEIDLEFNYPDAEVEVNDFRFSPSSVCPGDTVEFRYEIENTGNDDQDSLRTRLRSNILGIEEIQERFSLDGRDDERTESRFFSDVFTVPNDADERTYDFTFEVFYEDEDGDDVTKFQTHSLTVEDCSRDSTSSNGGSSSSGSNNNDSGSGFVVGSESSTTNQPQPNQPTTTTGANTGSAVVTAQPKDDSSALQTFGIIVLVIILLAVIVSLVGLLLKK